MGSEIQTNGRHFVKNHLKSGKNELISKGLVFELLGLLPLLKPDHLKFDLQKVQISDPNCMYCLRGHSPRRLPTLNLELISFIPVHLSLRSSLAKLLCSSHNYIRLLRCCTASGSSTGFSQVSPTKVGARKSFLFTESCSVLKQKNTGLILIITLL